MIEIVQNGHPVLRKIAKEVAISDITKPKVQKILEDMKKALHSQDDGVAIACPQIGESYRIFIVSGRIFDEDFIRGTRQNPVSQVKAPHKDLIFINPVFKKISKDRKLMVVCL